MNLLIKWASKWASGKRTKAAGVCAFALALLGVAINIDPTLLPMVDVMSWDAIGGWVVFGFACFGLGGKADKAIEAVKENTEAVKEAGNANSGITGQTQSTATDELTEEQRDNLNAT